MNISLLPELSGAEKEMVKGWLVRVLVHNRLSDSSSRWPLAVGRLGVYIGGVMKPLGSGVWDIGPNSGILYLGSDNPTGPLADRLGVLAAVITLCGLWDELLDAYSTAVSRVLLESYNEMMQGLLVSRGGRRAVGLAFSADRQQVAARMGEDGYFLPNGEQAQVDDTWVVVQ